MPYRVAVAVSGRGSNLAALLRALESAPIARVMGVFSNRPDAGALSLARAHDIPTVVFSDPADADAWLLALGGSRGRPGGAGRLPQARPGRRGAGIRRPDHQHSPGAVAAPRWARHVRSVWVGPYGGYSYNQGYNPRTGRYGYVETAWDGDEWASYGETYNPRTGVATETGRYYDEDSNRSEMERTVERGEEWIHTERETDWDTGQSTTERETSRGGSSTTTRDGDSSRTDFETGAGGSGTSISQDGNRTTIGQSAEGDLYAGHNGNVYKKTDDGWQTYDPGSGWSDVQAAALPARRGDPRGW